MASTAERTEYLKVLEKSAAELGIPFKIFNNKNHLTKYRIGDKTGGITGGHEFMDHGVKKTFHGYFGPQDMWPKAAAEYHAKLSGRTPKKEVTAEPEAVPPTDIPLSLRQRLRVDTYNRGEILKAAIEEHRKTHPPGSFKEFVARTEPKAPEAVVVAKPKRATLHLPKLKPVVNAAAVEVVNRKVEVPKPAAPRSSILGGQPIPKTLALPKAAEPAAPVAAAPVTTPKPVVAPATTPAPVAAPEKPAWNRWGWLSSPTAQGPKR